MNRRDLFKRAGAIVAASFANWKPLRLPRWPLETERLSASPPIQPEYHQVVAATFVNDHDVPAHIEGLDRGGDVVISFDVPPRTVLKHWDILPNAIMFRTSPRNISIHLDGYSS